MTSLKKQIEEASEEHAMRFDPESKFTSMNHAENAQTSRDFLAGSAFTLETVLAAIEETRAGDKLNQSHDDSADKWNDARESLRKELIQKLTGGVE